MKKVNREKFAHMCLLIARQLPLNLGHKNHSCFLLQQMFPSFLLNGKAMKNISVHFVCVAITKQSPLEKMTIDSIPPLSLFLTTVTTCFLVFYGPHVVTISGNGLGLGASPGVTVL